MIGELFAFDAAYGLADDWSRNQTAIAGRESFFQLDHMKPISRSILASGVRMHRAQLRPLQMKGACCRIVVGDVIIFDAWFEPDPFDEAVAIRTAGEEFTTVFIAEEDRFASWRS